MADAARDYEGMEEKSLIGFAAAGDRLAFRAIMKRCNQRLFRVARAVTGNDDEAEDVLQAAYLSAFNGIAAFRGESSLLTWLSAITLNEARSRLRKRRPTVDVTMLDEAADRVVPFPGAPTVANPEAEAGRAQIRPVLEAAIDALPPDFRVVFVLREIEGCSVEECAAQLGIPAATVKTRYFRAKHLLRAGLQRKFAAGMEGIFPFLGKRCDAFCDRVMERLG